SAPSSGFHSCGIHTDGTLWCWGYNQYGQLGQSAWLTSFAQTSASSWIDVAAGAESACAVKSDGTLWCWGANLNLALGISDFLQRSAPTQVGVATNWSSVTAGAYHGCAIKTDGTLWCWGRNSEGQVGNGTTTSPVTSPTQVGIGTTWRTVTAGYYHTCATQTNLTVWCWGYDAYGGLGNGSTTQQTSPTQVGTG